MPELTAFIIADNSARHVREALDSVLRQAGVEFDVLVIDDGSTDETSRIIKAFDDPRITLVRHDKRRGAAYCHQLVLDHSKSPFVVNVAPDDLVLPDAFKKMLAWCQSSAAPVVVQGYFFDLDEAGNVTRDAHRLRREFFLNRSNSEIDHRGELFIYGNVLTPLRMYTRDAFWSFTEITQNLKNLADGKTLPGNLANLEVNLLPEYLYCHRSASASIGGLAKVRALCNWARRLFYYHRLLKGNRVQSSATISYDPRSLLMQGFYHTFGLPKVRRWAERLRALRDLLRRDTLRILSYGFVNFIYYSIIVRLSWWPLTLFPLGKRRRSCPVARIAYYTWHFPILSQTFLHRELAALKKSGVGVEIIADDKESLETADANALFLMPNTHYLEPMDKARLQQYKRFFFRNKPFAYLHLMFFVMTHRYDRYKYVSEDAAVFSRAVYLAGVLRDQNIGHLHAPWADRSALTALLASKLLGVGFSFQGRAHDIHRHSYLYGLREKFRYADFIITNTRYNEAYIRSWLGRRHWKKITTIYNGIDLERFVPTNVRQNHSRQTRLLCVARLIEQKGLVYLLKACKILKDRGYKYQCEIVGDSEEPLYRNYFIELKKLHRHLGLADAVIFPGAAPFNKVLEKYQEADIFILPSVIAEDGSRDITPNSVIEAMAMKLPVISTTVTGIPEIVQDGVSGILVPPGDERDLAEAMIKLIEDPGLRAKLGENARRRVEERFDVSKNIGHYIDLFSGKLQPSKGPAKSDYVQPPEGQEIHY